MRAFSNQIGKNYVLGLDEESHEAIKDFLMYLMDTTTEYGAKVAIDRSKRDLSELDEKELNNLMDKALDERDFKKAKEIGDHLKKFQ